MERWNGHVRIQSKSVIRKKMTFGKQHVIVLKLTGIKKSITVWVSFWFTAIKLPNYGI